MSQDTPTVGTALSANTAVKKRTVTAWAFWDWGTQPFNTVITTFVFSVYLTSAYFQVGGDKNGPSLALSVATLIGGLVIALAAPVLGQTADRSGTTVRNLRWMTWALGLISMALYFVRPEPSFLWLGLILLVVGTVISEIASVNYNALIDRVAAPSNVGKVSGFGWGMGYLGGIIVLLVLLVLFIQPSDALNVWHLDQPTGIRVSMIVCGIWTLAFTIPIFVALRDRKPTGTATARLGVIGSYKALGRSIMNLWRTQRDTAFFLISSAIFRDGLAGVFTFGAVIASTAYGMSATTVIIFGAAANLIAGVVTMLFGLLDDKIGPKRVIVICLCVLVAGTVLAFVLHDPAYSHQPRMADPNNPATLIPDPDYDPALSARGQTIFWVLGLIFSSMVGPAQAASRSFLARVIPEGRTGEVFGLYTTTGRVISFLSPALFGAMVWVGAQVTGTNATGHWGLLGIGAVLLAGLIALLPVKTAQDSRPMTLG